MAPAIIRIGHAIRSFDPGLPSTEFLAQWKHPSDIFSVLLILGGDVVARALAQLAGSRITPVAFSFGWVAYAVSAVVSAVGENKLMPLPDCDCKVINGRNGYIRDNSSWVIGRILRDFEWWMDAHDNESAKERKAGRRPIQDCLNAILDQKWRTEREKAERKQAGSGSNILRPSQSGLCVSVYKAQNARPGNPGYDKLYYLGFVTMVVQLGIAAIPCASFGDWGILLITAAGIVLSLAVGSLPQWKKEKWACRTQSSEKTFVLTRGNGSQHAIVIIGNGKGLDLEDLAAGPTNVNVSSSYSTRLGILALAFLWILLLITSSAIQKNTWFLLAVGGIGILQNIFVAGTERRPAAFGMPLTFERVIGKPKVMDALFEVEEIYPHLGRSMLDTFFPGRLRPNEEQRWKDLEAKAPLKAA